MRMTKYLLEGIKMLALIGAIALVSAPVAAGGDSIISGGVGSSAGAVSVSTVESEAAVSVHGGGSSVGGGVGSATRPDGSPVFTLPMVVGLLIFYALCLQCAATIAVIRRETNSWRWPVFAWTYMTALGYVGALIAYQLGSA